MATTCRMLITCDENLTDQCAGLKEYTGPDRFSMAQAADTHRKESGWLWGYRNGQSYDVCPSCRPAVEARIKAEALAPRSAPNA